MLTNKHFAKITAAATQAAVEFLGCNDNAACQAALVGSETPAEALRRNIGHGSTARVFGLLSADGEQNTPNYRAAVKHYNKTWASIVAAEAID